ncbi:MAG: hypothetical protein IKI84_11385 [Clostridia bacterium]|nr:hypothetical protein [Clostridia bacterium]
MPDMEKVIKGLEFHLKELSIGKTCYECPYIGDNPCEIQLIANALELLKGQEPKPVKIVYNAYSFRFYHCPNCNREFLEFYTRPKFCSKCGQAVKWDG